jgi:hypothetical protein
MTICETPDFVFPMQADVFYPIVEQGTYGNLKKQWILDRTIVCNLTPAGSAFGEEVKPKVNIVQEGLLMGRTKTDIRISTQESNNSITNIIVTNIRDRSGNPIHLETSGPRAGKSTIFEVATNEPYVGPFGSVEHYNLVLRRSENQAVDL